VLKSIEAQHGLLVERARGIYSFSHLTFQEYFTARYFVESSDPQALENLSSHITEKRWREVFLLTTEMLPNAEG
jgi:predicted NACHT family NTPase